MLNPLHIKKKIRVVLPALVVTLMGVACTEGSAGGELGVESYGVISEVVETRALLFLLMLPVSVLMMYDRGAAAGVITSPCFYPYLARILEHLW